MSEYSFSINGDQDELLIFSDIVTKLKSNRKDIFSLFKNAGHTLIPTQCGYFDVYVYQNIINYESHIILTCGDITNKRSIRLEFIHLVLLETYFIQKNVIVVVNLIQAMSFIQKNGQGMILYLFQEGRGINIINKIKAYDLQQKDLIQYQLMNF